MVRAVFGSLNLPSPAEFERGKRESYDFLYAYDFSRAEEPAKGGNTTKADGAMERAAASFSISN